MTTKLSKLQEIYKQSRTDEEQCAVKRKRLVRSLVFASSLALATCLKIYLSSSYSHRSAPSAPSAPPPPTPTH